MARELYAIWDGPSRDGIKDSVFAGKIVHLELQLVMGGEEFAPILKESPCKRYDAVITNVGRFREQHLLNKGRFPITGRVITEPNGEGWDFTAKYNPRARTGELDREIK